MTEIDLEKIVLCRECNAPDCEIKTHKVFTLAELFLEMDSEWIDSFMLTKTKPTMEQVRVSRIEAVRNLLEAKK